MTATEKLNMRTYMADLIQKQKRKSLHLFVIQMKKRDKTEKYYLTPFCQNFFYIIKTSLKNQLFRNTKELLICIYDHNWVIYNYKK